MSAEKLPKGWEIINGELWLEFENHKTFFVGVFSTQKLTDYANDPQSLYNDYKRSYDSDERGAVLLKYIDSLKKPTVIISDESYINCTKCNYLYSYGGPAICSGCKMWNGVK